MGLPGKIKRVKRPLSINEDFNLLKYETLRLLNCDNSSVSFGFVVIFCYFKILDQTWPNCKDFFRPQLQTLMMHYQVYGHLFVRKSPQTDLLWA